MVLPTEIHQTEERGGALRREGQTLPVLDPIDDLVILDTYKRLDSAHQDLPAADAKHPHVAQTSEPSKVDTLWGHPLDGQFASRRCSDRASTVYTRTLIKFNLSVTKSTTLAQYFYIVTLVNR